MIYDVNREQEEEGGALSGLRVLDLTDEKGFLCGRLLGDLGADVIKVEPPGGDTARNIGPFYHDIPDPEKSLYWFAYNANKRGITLNIEKEDGQALFKKLVGTADFIIESFPPTYLAGLGLDYKMLNQINHGIILTSITLFGQTGPKAHYLGNDITCWAAGGMMYISGIPDRPPLQVSFPQSYLNAGMEAALGSLIAHYCREMEGEGQHVDVSIQESVIALLMDTTEMLDLNKWNLHRSGYGWVQPGSGVVQSAGFPCKDGWVTLMSLGGAMRSSVNSFKALVAWMDEEGMAPAWLKEVDWVHDYSATGVTQERVDRVEAAITAFFKTKTKKELYNESPKKRILLAPISDVTDISKSEQLQAREFWSKVEHPELGDNLTYCGAFAKFSESPVVIRRRAPLIGEHNEEIYQGELGLSKERLITLKKSGVV